MELRPSLKFIKLSYVACLILAAVIGACMAVYKDDADKIVWLFVIPALMLFATVTRHFKRRFIKLEVVGDRIRYEYSFLSKSTRSEQLVNVQDVRVDQSIFQRMFNVGDLSMETAGQSSRIVIHCVDRPQEAADHILTLAHAQRTKPGSAALGTQGV